MAHLLGVRVLCVLCGEHSQNNYDVYDDCFISPNCGRRKASQVCVFWELICEPRKRMGSRQK